MESSGGRSSQGSEEEWWAPKWGGGLHSPWWAPGIYGGRHPWLTSFAPDDPDDLPRLVSGKTRVGKP